ncbi:MAG TPA: PQQ-binding-like beta-propeller repeat protein [Candidatus Acidoferrales bacterium]|nr:PQQ-binding-like beta-propeller repeat protein [Candidatus Acidoferrales bacterium]
MFPRRLLAFLLLSGGLLAIRIAAQRFVRESPAEDWPQFGWDVASSGAPRGPSRITAANVASMIRRQVHLDGTVDASVIYLHRVAVNGSPRDVFFVTTTYGKTIALDADNGTVLWEYTPPGFASWAGTAQITNSTPAADPDRQNIYAAAPDGAIRKLAIADGHVVWTTPITLLPGREKIASPLKVFDGHVIAVTGGYIGDAPPYQGHLAILDAQTGALLHVWNSLCSDRAGLIQPSSCASNLSAIWGRAGAVIDPDTGNIFVATGNGPFDGKTNWGDSVIELDPDATRILGNYSPASNAMLERLDLDLGSTSPVLLGPNMLAQGGKDAAIRLLGIGAIAGTAQHIGGELQTVSTPSSSLLFTAPAVWRDRAETWMFAADGGATAAWRFDNAQLTKIWSNPAAGTSPVVAGGLLYVYNPGGGLLVYNPRTGRSVATLSCGSGHWNSPIVIDGRIALPEGSANDHAGFGVLNIWLLPDAQ